MDIGVLFHRTPSGPPTACRPFFLPGPLAQDCHPTSFADTYTMYAPRGHRGPLSTKFQIPSYRSRSCAGTWVLPGRATFLHGAPALPGPSAESGSVTRNSESQKLHSTYGARTFHDMFHEPRIGICYSESGISEATFYTEPKIRKSEGLRPGSQFQAFSRDLGTWSLGLRWELEARGRDSTGALEGPWGYRSEIPRMRFQFPYCTVATGCLAVM